MPSGSLRAYARHREEKGLDGGTLAGVQRALGSGRITKEADAQIDFDKADADWIRNTAPSINSRTTRHRAAKLNPRPAGRETARRAAPAVGEQQMNQANQFAQARALKEGFHAGLAQLEFKRRSGDLLPKAEVEQRWSALISAARNRLLLVAAKCAPRVGVPDPRERQAIIEREIREALQSLADEDEASADAA